MNLRFAVFWYCLRSIFEISRDPRDPIIFIVQQNRSLILYIYKYSSSYSGGGTGEEVGTRYNAATRLTTNVSL